MIYVIRAIGTNRVKVGWSTDVSARMKSLKTASPYPLELVTTLETDEESLERLLHKGLRNYRVHGEWFELPEKTLNALIENDASIATRIAAAELLMSKDLEYIYPASKANTIKDQITGHLESWGLK